MPNTIGPGYPDNSVYQEPPAPPPPSGPSAFEKEVSQTLSGIGDGLQSLFNKEYGEAASSFGNAIVDGLQAVGEGVFALREMAQDDGVEKDAAAGS